MAALFLLLALARVSVQMQIGRFPMLMPGVQVNSSETYLCTPVKIDSTKSYYITGFEPNATMHTAHHMLLYGCGEPGNYEKSTWNCGEMNAGRDQETFPTCASGSASQILYAWARDAPKLELPQDVGFKVGAGTNIQYLVLQVHYMTKQTNDKSGLYLLYTLRTMPKLAGVFLLGTAGVVPAHKTEHMEVSCRINEKKTIYPFAYRTHTHALGKVVSGYTVRKDEHGNDKWTLLGKRDPLTPQMFYPTNTKQTIKYGDKIAARCTMVSNRDRPTYIGATNDDEMCNFYLMYYVEEGEPLEQKYCFSAGPPVSHWNDDDESLNNIPDDASSL